VLVSYDNGENFSEMAAFTRKSRCNVSYRVLFIMQFSVVQFEETDPCQIG